MGEKGLHINSGMVGGKHGEVPFSTLNMQSFYLTNKGIALTIT
jgi:hypothetical protein